MKNTIHATVLMIAMGALASACDSQQSDDTVLDPESYQYKGAADQLTASSGSDRAGGLAERFDLIQGRL